MTVKAIIFDFGGTLDSNGIDWFKRFSAGIAQKVGPLDEQQFEKYIRLAADGISELDDTPTLSMEGTVRRLCDHLQHHMEADSVDLGRWRPEEVADEFLAEALTTIETSRDVIEQLSTSYRLACISNNWGNVAGWCKDHRFDTFFETMVDSAVVGVRKPDARIFQAALDDMNIDPADCAYVGDNYDCDVIGSHAVGMRPVWITPATSPINGGAVIPLRITALTELLEIDWTRKT